MPGARANPPSALPTHVFGPLPLAAEAVEARDLGSIPEATVVPATCLDAGAPPTAVGRSHTGAVPASTSTGGASGNIPSAAMAFTVMPPDPHDVHYNGVYGGFPLRGTVRRVLPANGAAGAPITVFYEHDLESMMRRPRIQVPEEPPDHVPLALMSCLCCWFLSLAALWEGRMVHVLYGRGDYTGAYEASARARMFALMGIVVGGLLTLLALFTYKSS